MNVMAKFLRGAAALLLAVSVPAVLWMGMTRARRYAELRAQVAALEAEQRNWVEENKRLIADIASAEAPRRIEDLAKDGLDLKKAGPEDVLRVELGHD